MATRLATALAAACLCLPLSANASSVTVRVDGVVDFAEDDDGLLPPASAGDTFSITYVISATAPRDSCLESDLPQTGCYYGAVQSMTMMINGNTVTIPPTGEAANYQISANGTHDVDLEDRWTVHLGMDTRPAPPELSYSMEVALYAPGDSDLITDDSYRTIADPALATRSFIGIFAGRFFPDLTFETDDVIQGRITGITQITSIPEPAAASLMAAGLIALLATTCRRRWARPTLQR